MMNYKMTNV